MTSTPGQRSEAVSAAQQPVPPVKPGEFPPGVRQAWPVDTALTTNLKGVSAKVAAYRR